MIAAAAGLLWRLYSPPAPASATLPVQDIQEVIASENVAHVRGTGDVVLVEFADDECPFCARHAELTAPAIKAAFLDSGAIRQVFFNFPLDMHPRAQKASEAAECAAVQGRFWEMHESLFAEPNALQISDLERRAERLGLDGARFSKCLDEGETATTVKAHIDEGVRLGVRATPAFFLGRIDDVGRIHLIKRINGALPFEAFERELREMDSQKQAGRAVGPRTGRDVLSSDNLLSAVSMVGGVLER